MLTALKHVTIFIKPSVSFGTILYVRPLTYMAPPMPTMIHKEGWGGDMFGTPPQCFHFVAICSNVFTFNR